MAVIGFDTSTLLSYYASKLPLPASTSSAAASSSQTPAQTPPWDISVPRPTQQAEDVSSRSTDPYFDPTDLTLTSTVGGTSSNSGSELEALLKSTLSTNSTGSANPNLVADNDKLFALYSALNRLDYITQMATRDGTSAYQLPGLDKSFQDGLSQIMSFVKNTQFANVTVMPGVKTSSATASVSIAYPDTTYTGGAVSSDANVFNPVSGVNASDSFTISVTKGGNTTAVPIDLSNVQGNLTMDNIDAYVNQQLSAAGFGTRFKRVQTGGNLSDGTANWGIEVLNSPSEKISLSSTTSAPAIYVAGTTGNATDQQGKLLKLTDLTGNVTSAFSANITPDTGTAGAKATAVDAQGNVYVVGNSTGSFGNEINQGSQDVFLTKYDSAGNVQWTKLLGSADTASGFGIAVDPTSGGVVIAGAVTGDLTQTSIGGNTDTFVAKYDSEGNQVFVRQVAPASNDQANSVSVDSSGNIYVGGQVQTTISSGQTSAGGQDAYVTKLSSKGAVIYQRQFGTSGTDAAAKTAIADDGNLLVASVQNGHAILTKYNSGDGTSTPMWQVDLGDLQGGTIGGIAAANGHVHLTGTSANVALDAGGAATIAHASSGGTDAYVFGATDSGASASADFVSYVGTGAAETGGGIAVAGNKLYLTGSTTGTFAGETKGAGIHNLFVSQLGTDGTVDWTHQYGGVDGESTGTAIAANASGSSVLDALKLPSGTIDTNQSNAIASQTTARAGDYFTMQITDATGTRQAKVTLESDDTLRSLAVKINSALLFDGKATTLGVSGGQGLNIAVSAGVTVQLIAGSKDFDALAGLGLKPQTLINDGNTSGNTSGNSTGNTTKITDNANPQIATTAVTPQTIGLGIDGGLSLLDSTSAMHAHTVLQAAESLIKQAYSSLNTPQTATTTSTGTGTAPAYLQAQLASYQTALSYLSSLSGGS